MDETWMSHLERVEDAMAMWGYVPSPQEPEPPKEENEAQE